MPAVTTAVADLPGLPETLAALARQRGFAPGELVFRAHSPARNVHYLVSGRVVMHRFGPAGEEVVIHVAQPGEYFAEASLHSERYHCTAVAAAASEVVEIPSAPLRASLRADPAFAMQWLAIVSRQLRQARARVERLCLKGARERVRHLLLTEGRGARHAYTLRGTLKELAAELGLTHEALYRTLAAMEREGLLEREGRTILLPR